MRWKEQSAPRTNGLVLHWAARYDLRAWLLTHGRERELREAIISRQHRGLEPATVDRYRRYVEPFLQDPAEEARRDRFAELPPTRVREYLERTTPRLARVTRKHLVLALRRFLHFAFSPGYLRRDVARVIPGVPSFTLDRLPRGPRWEDLPRLLISANRSTKRGCRAFAILVILMTYGVRAGQLTHLRLDDIDWRQGVLRFPAAKRGRPIIVPLTAAVGDALLHYLRRGRPLSTAREIFLSLRAPCRPLDTDSISWIVARAFHVAGVASPHRGSHAIRHAWATRAVAQGQSLKTVADLLGHRSLDATRIYAKVDEARLRSVGLSWPQEVRS